MNLETFGLGIMRTMVGLDRHPLNSEGPFYGENGQCMSCGAPESETDGLMSHDAKGHCFFARQPLTDDETNAAIRGVWASCCGAVRYGGEDPQIMIRLAELGNSSQCDRESSIKCTLGIRNCTRFEYLAPKGLMSKRSILRQVTDIIAGSVGKYPGSKQFSFWYGWNEASFWLSWGKIAGENGHFVKFTVKYQSSDLWLVRISGYEIAHTAFAIQLDKALQRIGKFRAIRWFGDSEWPDIGGTGAPHPY